MFSICIEENYAKTCWTNAASAFTQVLFLTDNSSNYKGNLKRAEYRAMYPALILDAKKVLPEGNIL